MNRLVQDETAGPERDGRGHDDMSRSRAALLATTAAVGLVALLAGVSLPNGSAWADGGHGADGNPAGGAGGNGYVGNAGAIGQSGPAGSFGGGGGGGGAGGGAGGQGGDEGANAGGTGGAGGTSNAPGSRDGANGAAGAGQAGTGGGGGGFNGNGAGSSSITGAGNLTGGAGGVGGDSGRNYGGGGGAGGYGGVVTGATSSTYGATIQGGAGGAGGNGGSAGNGSGGAGGVGLTFATSGASLTLQSGGSVTGGAGGAAGVNRNTPAYGSAGSGGIGITGSGLTIINGGTITGGLGNAGAGARANSITFIGASNVLELQAGSTITGNVIGTGTDTFRLGGTAAGSFDVSQIGAAAQYRGFSTFVKTGTSTWTLTGTTAAATPWTFAAGTLNVGSAGALGSAGTLAFTGGTLQYSGANTTDYSGRFATTAGQQYSIDTNGQTVTFGTGLSSSGGSLTKLGAGTLILNQSESYTGATDINAGTLQVGPSGALIPLSPTSAFTVASGATLDLNGSFPAIGSLAGAGTVTNSASTLARLATGSAHVSSTFAGIIEDGTGDGQTQLVVGSNSPAFTFTLTGANTYTGGTSICTCATLQLGNGGTTGSIVGNVADGGTLAFNRSDTYTFSGVISDDVTDAGKVVQMGPGTTVLAANNTYTGSTTISAGTLRGGAANAFSAASATSIGSGGILDLGGFAQAINAVTLGGGTLRNGTLTGAVTATGGTISALGGGATVTTTSGTTTLAGTNTYTGATAIHGGTLQGGAAATFSAASATSIGSGGILDLGGFAQAINAVTLGGGTLRNGTLTGAVTSTGGTISALGGGATVTTTSGTTTLSGINTFTGNTAINGGTLQGGAAGTFSAASATSIGSGGILDLGGFAQTINAVAIHGGTLRNGTLTGAVTSTGGAISALGGGATITTTAGTTTLAGTNTYTGATAINAGTLQGGAAGTFSVASATSIGSGGILDFGGFAQTINAVALGGGTLRNGTLTGAVTSTGGTISALGGSATVTTTAGTTTFAGTNTYTGATAINGGTLQVDGTVTQSPITVNAGGTLSGTGKIGDPTIAAGGTLAPGNAGAPFGTLTIVGPLGFSVGSFYNVAIDAAGQNSRTNVVGATTITGGTVDVAAGAGAYASNTRYTLLNATNGVSGTFSAVATNLAFLAPTLSYDATNVFLTVLPTTPTGAGTPDYRTAASTPNQFAVASGVTNAGIANGGAGPVLAALNQLTAAQARATFDNLSGEGMTATQQLAHRSAELFTATIFDQTTFYGANSTTNSVTLTAPQAGLTALASIHELADLPSSTQQPALPVAPARTWRAWATGFASVETIHGNDDVGSATQNDTIYGGTLGVDYQLTSNYVVGVALGGSDGTFAVPNRATSGSTTGGHVAFYDIATFGSFYGASSTSFSYYTNKTTRSVSGFGGLVGETERGTFDSQEVRGRLEFGRHIDGVGETVTPFVALELAELRSNGFSESSQSGPGLLALNVSGQSSASVPSFLGARYQGLMALGHEMALSPSLEVAYVHEFAPQRTQFSTLNDLPGSAFLVNGASPSYNAAKIKAGGELALNANSALFATFDGEFSGTSQLYGGKGGFRYRW